MFNLVDKVSDLTSELKRDINLGKENKYIFSFCDERMSSYGWVQLTSDPMVYDNNTLVKTYYKSNGKECLFFFIGISTKKQFLKKTKHLMLESSISKKCPAFLITQANMMYSIKQQTTKKSS